MSKKRSYMRSRIYEVDYIKGKIRLRNKLCPRCGRVMANHKDRWSCGYCQYTIFTQQK
ncbi:MAG: 30S ribosomal protein S27ae [Candidatus Nezhaarchaeota archaeon]|nr:30S ribosomal protein S27ae [Candidatus Nezhaarchaeota archaeon]MCX8141564.1 30S ribosomal protein S27ae [Candidatus Nezhaarchaeota archaeon]MDW8049831.1 30S ribosomal protein S27ae [Nitrososphaerota archaeon]